MAKEAYNGVSNRARKVKEIYIGVNNKARKVKEGYVGVNNKARQFWSGNNYAEFDKLEEIILPSPNDGNGWFDVSVVGEYHQIYVTSALGKDIKMIGLNNTVNTVNYSNNYNFPLVSRPFLSQQVPGMRQIILCGYSNSNLRLIADNYIQCYGSDTNPINPPGHNYVSGILDEGKILLLRYNFSNEGVITYANTHSGSSFTNYTLSKATNMNGRLFKAGNYYVGYGKQYIIWSSDGITWKEQLLNNSSNIAYGNCNNNYIYFSDDGTKKLYYCSINNLSANSLSFYSTNFGSTIKDSNPLPPDVLLCGENYIVGFYSCYSKDYYDKNPDFYNFAILSYDNGATWIKYFCPPLFGSSNGPFGSIKVGTYYDTIAIRGYDNTNCVYKITIYH